MMKRGRVDKQGEPMVASYRYLGVSNPGLKMIGSNVCDVSCLYGTQASFQYIRRIPALYESPAYYSPSKKYLLKDVPVTLIHSHSMWSSVMEA